MLGKVETLKCGELGSQRDWRKQDHWTSTRRKVDGDEKRCAYPGPQLYYKDQKAGQVGVYLGPFARSHYFSYPIG
jgi:hypothetical protein